jgi:hypothetical protein
VVCLGTSLHAYNRIEAMDASQMAVIDINVGDCIYDNYIYIIYIDVHKHISINCWFLLLLLSYIILWSIFITDVHSFSTFIYHL